jgi:hypothetical protein
MTPEQVTLDAVLRTLIAAVVGAIVMLIIPALGKRLAGTLDNANEVDKTRLERERRELEEETTQELIDMETRQLANRLAMKAFDREEELARRNAEYQAQGELLTLTRKALEDCRAALQGCNEVQVDEYKRHETALLDRIYELERIIEGIKARSDEHE